MNFLEPQAEEKDEELPEVETQQYLIETPGGNLVMRDPFNPDFIPAIFKPFHAEVDKMANAIQGLKVTDSESSQKAGLYSNQAQQLVNALSKTTKAAGEPYKKITDILAEENKALAGRLKTIKAQVDIEITSYLLQEGKKRKEAEQKAKEEQAKLQAELDEKARKEREAAAEEARKKAEAEGLSKKKQEEAARNAAALVEDAPVAVFDAPAETKVVTSAGSAKIEEEDSWEILDYRALPDGAFNELNPKPQEGKTEWPHPYIRRQLKAGIRNIPGVKVFKVQKLATRAAKRGTSQGKW